MDQILGQESPTSMVMRYGALAGINGFLDCGPVVDCIVLDEVSWISYALGLWFVKPAVAAFPTVGI